MKIITKVELTEEEKEIIEQAKSFYKAYSKSSFHICKNGAIEDCENCPFCTVIDYDDHCVIEDLADNLLGLIEGAKNA